MQSIIRIYFSTPIHSLFYAASLILASIMLNYRQYVYAFWLLDFPDLHPAKEILLVSLKKGDKSFQLGELSENTLM